MRFIHTADWHLGKIFCGIRQTEDQRQVIMQEFLPLVKDSRAEAVIIAGDIYDHRLPEQGAVEVFDEFLARLAEMQVKLFAIAGNHDSGARIDYGRRLFRDSGIFIRGAYSPQDEPVILEDEHGKVAFSLLPYLNPASAKEIFKNQELALDDFDAATGLMAEQAARKLPKKTRSIAVAHAFVAGSGYAPEESDSERELLVGGAANVSPKWFKPFNYTALGHIHKPQQAGAPNIRYSGSLLPYSFSEAEDENRPESQKSVLVAEMDAQGKVKFEPVHLAAPHRVRRFEGFLRDLLEQPASEDYLAVTLLDQSRLPGAVSDIKEKFPHHGPIIWQADLARAQADSWQTGEEMRRKTELEQFDDFLRHVSGCGMNDEESNMVAEAIAEARHLLEESKVS